jgi:transcriptional regulator GlxA family with amidase domain
MQLSRKGEAAPVGRSALQEAQRWIAANPAEDLSIAKLASRTGLSSRHFARLASILVARLSMSHLVPLLEFNQAQKP